jgi:dTMP kinase
LSDNAQESEFNTSKITNILSNAWSRGLLIAVCGIDGSGKSTLIKRLDNFLGERGVEVVITEQPTNFYRSASSVRAYHDRGEEESWQEGLALLSAYDRLLHLKNTIVPALLSGKVVISHRFGAAARAIFTSRGLEAQWIESINRYCPRPHVSFLLDCPGKIAVDRIAARRGRIRLEERSAIMLEKIRKAYLDGADRSTHVIDAQKHQDEIFDECKVILNLHLKSCMATKGFQLD